MTTVMQEKPRNIPTETKHDVTWEMNRRCNFNCVYCFRKHSEEDSRTEDPACVKYSPEHIAQRFDEIGKPWRIRLTGGEPLLYPDFVRLASLLTRQHHISVNTNLSTSKAYEFADAVKPERVPRIYANLHILEREKRSNGVSDYLKKFLYFQELGFDIRLGYVTYPPLLGRIAADLNWWRSQGVRRIVVKVFQGEFDGKRYPRDYDDEERSLLKRLGLNDSEGQILDRRSSFLGRKCQAGHRAFAMDISGNVTRCTSLREDYGNLFEGTFRPSNFSRRCPARKCVCTYEGIRFSSLRGSSTPSHIIVKPAKFLIGVGEHFTGLERVNPFLYEKLDSESISCR